MLYVPILAQHKVGLLQYCFSEKWEFVIQSMFGRITTNPNGIDFEFFAKIIDFIGEWLIRLLKGSKQFEGHF